MDDEMKEYQVKMAAELDGDFVFIKVVVDDATMTMRYKDKESIAVIASNLENILEYMWQDYLVRKEFSDQLNNELEDWLRDG